MVDLIVTLYIKENCSICEQVKKDLDILQDTIPHQTVIIDIGTSSDLKNKYDAIVPVIEVGPYQLQGEVRREDLCVTLAAARDRKAQLDQIGDKKYLDKVNKGLNLSGTDRFSYWFSNSYMHIFNLIVFIYVGLPFFAAVLMKANVVFPARVIYTIYSPLCHQLAFRSWFLFGEQPYYPRSLAGIPDVITYEKISANESIDLTEARKFIGNDLVGYKVALCERDVAIYGAILAFGLVFSFTGKRIKPLSWLLWVGVGIIPLGLDGGSQLLGLMTGIMPSWVPIRESSPLLRTLTGGLFGLTTAWYLYPMIEDSVGDTRRLLMRKIAVVSHLKENQDRKF